MVHEGVHYEGENVTEIYKAKALKSVNSEEAPIMNNDSNGPDKLKKQLGEFAEHLQTFRVAPSLGRLSGRMVKP